MKKLFQTIRRTISIFTGNDMPVYAGFAALKISTAVFPLFMLIIALLNWIPAYSPQNLSDFLFSMLPDLPEVKTLFTNVMFNLRVQSSGLLASVAALTAFWSASAGVSSIQRGLKKMNAAPKGGIREKLKALLFTAVLVILIPALLLFNVMGEYLIGLIRRVAVFFGIEAFTGTIAEIIRVSGIITACAAVLIILLLYTFLPGGKRSLPRQLPGAVLTTAGWIAFTWLFSEFMPIFWKSSVYGSLASLFLTLLWLQISISIFFLGGALNRALENEEPSGEKH